MTLLVAILTAIIAHISGVETLKGGYEPTLKDDPILQSMGTEQSQANPAQMARAGFSQGHCPRG